MSDDAHRARLAKLAAEVKAAATADAERKARARAAIEARRAEQKAESDQLRARQAALLRRQAGREPEGDVDEDRPRGRARGDELGSALALARKASDARQELARPRKSGEKSWMISGALSLFFGPVGWLYAGSWREAVPAAVGYLTAIAIVTKILPLFLLMPVLMFALPLSGIAGVVYAIGHNRKGKRVRLFGEGDGSGEKDDRRIGKLGSGDGT
jgi:hypothetical protein